MPTIDLATAAMDSPPFDWCDRRCERCPLANECALLGLRDGRAAHDAREERRDDLAWVIAPPDPGLELAADAVLFGLGDLIDACEQGVLVEPFEGLVAAIAFVVGRARSLAVRGPSALARARAHERDGQLDWEASVVLLERATSALRRTVGMIRPAAPAKILGAGLEVMGGEVARWNACVSDGFRIALGARIREGTAPSPFCTTDH